MLDLPEIADEYDVVEQLRDFISASGIESGSRLPPERELMNELDVSRSTLRKALDALERDGVIWRHVGKGTFVATPKAPSDDGSGDQLAPATMRLAKQLTPFRMMRARLTVEPAIAKEAALNASSDALVKMQLALERSHSASSWELYERQDDLFHRAIAEASDNILLLSVFDQLNAVRRAVAFGNVVRATTKPKPNHDSFTEHEIIANAIAERRPADAYTAMRKHLHSVSERLFGEA